MNERIVCAEYSDFLMKVKEMIGGGEFSKENGGVWMPQDDPSIDCLGIVFYKFTAGKNGQEDREDTYHLLVSRLAIKPSPSENPLFREILDTQELVKYNVEKEIKRNTAQGVH